MCAYTLTTPEPCLLFLLPVEWEKGGAQAPCVEPAVLRGCWGTMDSANQQQPGWAKAGGGRGSCSASFPDLGVEEEGREVKAGMLGSRPGVQTHNLVLMFSFSKRDAWSLG